MRLSAHTLAINSGLEDAALTTDAVAVRPMPALVTRLLGSSVHAMTLGSHILVHPDRVDELAEGDNPELLAHELIHVEQWRENGACRFLATYIGDYLHLRLLGLTHDQAYRGIRFESDAYRQAARIVAEQ